MAKAWAGRRVSKLLATVLSTYGSTCHLCHLEIDLDLPARHADGPSADHLLPRSKGGSDDLSNLRPAHLRCNSRRGARSIVAPRARVDARAFFQPEAR